MAIDFKESIDRAVSLTDIITLMHNKGYDIYEQPFKLNIFGIRSIAKTVNVFNDRLGVFYKDYSDVWQIEYWAATTKPGLYWLRNLINPKGTAILKPGQYVDTYAIDYHNGKYLALCQRLKKVAVYRDQDKDAELDIVEGTVEWGMNGINLHRASLWKVLSAIDKNSAGCQVTPNIKNFERLMNLAEMHRKIYGNVFTYTLLKEEDMHIQVTESLTQILFNKIFRRQEYVNT
jgi:hypothetical protein